MSDESHNAGFAAAAIAERPEQDMRLAGERTDCRVQFPHTPALAGLRPASGPSGSSLSDSLLMTSGAARRGCCHPCCLAKVMN